MKELEKLNTFQAALADVNEDCEFFVSSGPYKSDPHRVAVYDPLVVKGFEIVTKYPEYMKLPDRLENGETPDVTAPVGSIVTMKILTNRPLKSGDLVWEKGEPSHGNVAGYSRSGSAANTALAVSFPVQASTTFRYRLSDVNRQVAESPAPANLTAVIDQPPTVKLLKPGPTVNGNPLSEIQFLAEVSDDFGLGGGELVVRRSNSVWPQARARSSLGTVDGRISSAVMPNLVRSSSCHCSASAGEHSTASPLASP